MSIKTTEIKKARKIIRDGKRTQAAAVLNLLYAGGFWFRVRFAFKLVFRIR